MRSAAVVLVVAGAAMAQTEVLYITDGDAADMKAIQGGSRHRRESRNRWESPLSNRRA